MTGQYPFHVHISNGLGPALDHRSNLGFTRLICHSFLPSFSKTCRVTKSHRPSNPLDAVPSVNGVIIWVAALLHPRSRGPAANESGCIPPHGTFVFDRHVMRSEVIPVLEVGFRARWIRWICSSSPQAWLPRSRGRRRVGTLAEPQPSLSVVVTELHPEVGRPRILPTGDAVPASAAR